jgi:Cu-processing system permease protein
LLLARPIQRQKILIGQYLGLSVALCTALLIGLGIPILLYTPEGTGLSLIASGLALTLCFVSIAVLASVVTRDKSKGIGISILLWFLFTLIYDGIILWILFRFNDYPLEKPILILTALNPIDLARIVLLLKIDLSAFMGYTGALYKDYFGTAIGMAITTGVLLCWIVIPLLFSIRIFTRKDI